MIHLKISALTVFLLALALVAEAAPVSQPTIGMHRLQVSTDGVRSQLVSIPFLRLADAQGRLDGLQPGTEPNSIRVLDLQAAFAGLMESGATYILRLTDGMSAGDWFVLGEADALGQSVALFDDGLAGNVSDLVGDEAFSIHRLFTLAELFPEDAGIFPASAIDLRAMQVHFYDGVSFAKYWLSNGTITQHTGWTCSRNGSLKYAGNLAILPGSSFIVVSPKGTGDHYIQINGLVPERGLSVPIYEGFNYVSVKYTQALNAGSDPQTYLKQIGLIESGFQAGASPEAGDLVLALNPITGSFIESYYLDSVSGEFLPAGEPGASLVSLAEVGPGRGFIILNRGGAYRWSFNLEHK